MRETLSHRKKGNAFFFECPEKKKKMFFVGSSFAIFSVSSKKKSTRPRDSPSRESNAVKEERPQAMREEE